MCIKLNNHTFSDPCVVFLLFWMFFLHLFFCMWTQCMQIPLGKLGPLAAAEMK